MIVEAVFVIVVIVIIAISNFTKKKDEGNKEDMAKHEWKTTTLKHSDCDISATSCLHEENIDKDQKICRNCGYQNEKGKKNCSVCGKRL